MVDCITVEQAWSRVRWRQMTCRVNPGMEPLKEASEESVVPLLFIQFLIQQLASKSERVHGLRV